MSDGRTLAPTKLYLVIVAALMTVAAIGGGLYLLLDSSSEEKPKPVVVSETQETEEAALAVREFVRGSGDEELRRNLETANTVRLGGGLFRTCVARDDRREFECLLIDTNAEPVRIRIDPNSQPNSSTQGR